VNHSCKYGHCYDEKILMWSNDYEFCQKHTCQDERCRQRKWTQSRGNFCKEHTCRKHRCFERNHVQDGVGNRYCIKHIMEGLKSSSVVDPTRIVELDASNHPVPPLMRPVPQILVSTIPDDRSVLSASSAATDDSWKDVFSPLPYPVPYQPPYR
jgi:hypothetical protein